MRYMGWVGKFEKYYGVLRRGGWGVNKIFGYYVVFASPLKHSKPKEDQNLRK